ncbi:T9SS type A sorting domain-containing protein [Winogradskyella schleiferi]|uniref:T9SS type A sorting domain-containing protein n=1 Tax=Winogradskyella schleiferi TaxID=2686078 RepID=UPI0015B94873|nr:T9SS type A sorting domain-containing protein [Winogradskyella schleiferi]
MKKFYTLLFALMLAALCFGQTTVSYDFSSGGAVNGLNEASPGIALDANIGFGSFRNSGTSNPGIFSSQLRLYQNATKGGSIIIYANNGVTITDITVNASGTTGPAGYTVDGGTATNLSASSTYTISGISATSEVEFYQRDGSSSNRIYVDSFEVTYTSGGSCTAPFQASAFQSITSNSTNAEFSFTRGGGNDVLVLMREGSAVDADPTNGTSYTANSEFNGAGASEIGTGNFVVFNGNDGTSNPGIGGQNLNVSVTGLTPDTTYHLAIYEYNTTGTCYQLDELSESFTTAAVTTVQFASTSDAVAEDVGTYDLVIEIANEDAAATTFDVVLTFGDAADIASYSTQSESFPGSSTTDITVTITVTDDAITEGDEVFTFELQNVAGGNSAAAGTNNSFDLTILASDAPTTGTLYDADFSNDGDGFPAHSDASPPAAGPAFAGPFGSSFNHWTLSYDTTPGTDGTDNTFEVSGGELQTRDWGGQGIFTSQSINVSGVSSVDISATGLDVDANQDEFTYFYILDGGSRVETIVSSGDGDPVNYSIVDLDVSGASTLEVGFEFSENGSDQGYDVSQFIVTAGCTAPTAQASAYNTTALGTTSATLNWTSGDGDEVLVVIKEGTPVDTDPTNGTSYTGNTVFASGDEIGTGNYVVQSGSATSSVSVTGLNSGTSYHVAVYEYNTTDTCYELTELTGNFTTVSISNDANIVEASYDEPDNINYLSYNATSGLDVSNAIKIAEFTIQDSGDSPADSDNLPTILNELTFTVIGADNIAALALIDESVLPEVTISEITTVTASTTFSGLTIQADDNLSQSFAVYATFKSTVTDNEQIQLIITNAVADVNNSTFADANAGGAFTSIDEDDNRIEVTATDLIFDTNTSNVTRNVVMDPSPTVLAVDINANTDEDFTETVSLTPSTSGIFSLSASTVVAPVLGIATFDNLKLNAIGSGYTVTANSNGLNSDTSNPFNVTAAVPSLITDLFFSEYIEGSGQTRCLEIYNGTGANVDLSDYSIRMYFNGSSSFNPSSTINLSGTLLDGDVYVICDNDSSPTFLALADLTPSSSFFNGNDAVSLVKSGTRIDLIGNIGCDPASGGWTDSGNGNSTLDQTLVRNNNVCGGAATDATGCNGTFPTLGSEWTSFAQNTSTNLGSHSAICSDVADCNTFGGNGKTGFGGPIGNGSLEVCTDSGTTIDFEFTRGTSDFFNNAMVIYIDSQPGGIANTDNLTDSADSGRRAVSGFNGSQRASVIFPPGFRPEYALVVRNDFANLFGIVENGSHTSIQNAGLSPENQNSAASYTFNIDFASINASANTESFNFLVTYLNADSGFRSNESIGRNTAAGNPGSNPIEMLTYYQVNSGKQGGIANSDDNGSWTSDASWTNGNPPLLNDEVIINHAVILDTNYEANSINVTASNSLTVNTGQTLSVYSNNLDTNDGLFGSGTLNVDGKLLISEGGFTTITPSYNSGSILEYRNIDAEYDRFNEWTDGTTVGLGVPDNIIIENASLDLTNGSQSTFENFTVGTNLTLLTNGNLTVDPNETLSIGNNLLITNGSLDLNSNSTTYSSLLVSGSSIGDVIYRRHVNTFSDSGNDTGENDLISPPVTNANQTFEAFKDANPNIPTGLIGGVPSFLFGPFNNETNAYVNYTSADYETVLTPGIGYRSASTDTSTFTFIGDVQTATVSVGINIGTGSIWNLVGNPYTTYMNSGAFLTANAAVLDEDAIGIYGYDGSAENGWDIINFNNMNEAENLTPGQGFLLAAEGTSLVEFTPVMQRIAGGDDFISGRSTDANAFLRLTLESTDSNYHTDFYFNDNSSRMLDPGYDAALFNGYLPEFYMFSHLVENNTGRAMAIQSLASSDLSDVTVPIGVNANQGEQLTFGIGQTTLPSSVKVYLDDTVANTSTLLTAGNYTLTANTNLSGTGRFYLRFSESTLSTSTPDLDQLSIYCYNDHETIVIAGQLSEATTATLYDIQGRKVFSTLLENTNSIQTIDVSSLNAGVYVVQLINGTQTKTQKVIIK